MLKLETYSSKNFIFGTKNLTQSNCSNSVIKEFTFIILHFFHQISSNIQAEYSQFKTIIIPETKFVKKVFKVKPIPNQIPHIKSPKFTHKIHMAKEKPDIKIIIFIVLVTIQKTSSFQSSQSDCLAKIAFNLTFTTFVTTTVQIITSIAKNILKKVSLEKIDQIQLKSAQVQSQVSSVNFVLSPDKLGDCANEFHIIVKYDNSIKNIFFIYNLLLN